MAKYIGTFVAPHCGAQDMLLTRRGVVVVDSFARRRGPAYRAVAFVRACLLWARVQRLRSRA